MAFTYGFYDSLNGDRKYNAEQMSAIFDGIIRDGVFSTIGNIFDVTPGAEHEVLVDTGKAWFNHTWNINNAPLPLAIEPADVYFNRIDAIVLEVNKDVSVRENAIKVIRGEYAVDPVKPELANEDPVWQYPLAYLTVKAGAVSYKASDIEKTVGRDPCPFVTGILESTDITNLFSQWEGNFDEWFQHLQEQLSGDVATNLQNQIDEINEILSIMNEHVGIMTVTVQTPSGKPIQGIAVDGVYTEPNGSVLVKTNAYGIAKGYIAEGSQTIAVKNYLDIEADVTKTVQIVQANKYEEILTVTPRNFYKITSTSDWRFSGNVSRVDLTVVGGGGGGRDGNTVHASAYCCGGGGGGGAVVVQEDVSFISNTMYNASIGAGGNHVGTSVNVQNVPYGGTSSFLSISAAGGQGGPYSFNTASTSGTGGAGGTPGGGQGGTGYWNDSSGVGNPTSGKAGSSGYDSFTTTAIYGGGGGGGYGNKNNGGNGGGGAGAQMVGAGSTATAGVGDNGTKNTGGGGGGGLALGSTAAGMLRSNGGNGGSGVIAVRMHLRQTS